MADAPMPPDDRSPRDPVTVSLQLTLPRAVWRELTELASELDHTFDEACGLLLMRCALERMGLVRLQEMLPDRPPPAGGSDDPAPPSGGAG